MLYKQENPLIVQSDMTMLLEVDSPLYPVVRDAIASFSEIVKSPEHIHTYRITPISLWNAAASGISDEEIIARLKEFTKYEIPQNIIFEISSLTKRFGKLRLHKLDEQHLRLEADDPLILDECENILSINIYFKERLDSHTCLIESKNRGLLKQAFIKKSYPILDLAGYSEGDTLAINIRENENFKLRVYQIAARDAFYKGGSNTGGSGIITLPCGAGKTVIGLSIMGLIKTHTLILATGTTAVKQWKRELLDKTDLRECDIGEYTGELKEIRPVTITTYQIITHRKKRVNDFIHFNKLNSVNWGFIIYDEVHLLPAKVFRFTSSLQGIRRLGLTATLVREDNKEDEVFSLIGPKYFDVPWKVLEKQGWIATAKCYELRIPISPQSRIKYINAGKFEKFRVASENDAKHLIIEKLLKEHSSESLLIIGQFIDQLEKISASFGIPLITGKTKQSEREILYDKFRKREVLRIIVSSVANFAIDLPDASVAIEISGRFGSRQEEAQRLGRILRPKKDNKQVLFYSLVTKDTEEQDFALKRQLFLTEQGYTYNIMDAVI